jgi:hypothetical protein
MGNQTFNARYGHKLADHLNEIGRRAVRLAADVGRGLKHRVIWHLLDDWPRSPRGWREARIETQDSLRQGPVMFVVLEPLSPYTQLQIDLAQRSFTFLYKRILQSAGEVLRNRWEVDVA